MMPNAETCRSAHMARDPRFDGRFVVGVVTTGVFCRPICPARLPNADNARYFVSPAVALASGFRPCRRCRPAATAPAWTAASDTVLRALPLVEAGFLDTRTQRELATSVGVGGRQLARLFMAELGITPSAFARGRRLQAAWRLVEETDLSCTEVAMLAGFGSIRRFNEAFRVAFGQAPSAVRRQTTADTGSPRAEFRFQLPFRKPYNAAWVMPFLAGRAVGGIESVQGRRYRRRLTADTWVQAELTDDVLQVALPAVASPNAADLLARLRRLFDLDADPVAIDAHLAQHPDLAPRVAAAPGIRMPGVWDAFEGAVRAIIGQQVSVARATTLARTICERFGDGAFPSAEVLARVEVAAIGMPGVRGRAVSAVARRVADAGDGWLKDAEALRVGFSTIRGLGPWTTEYAAMRIARDPDAFPESDWGVFKALGVKGKPAREWAEPCRPWRAYATMLLWSSRSQ